jgi:hypothetical protein
MPTVSSYTVQIYAQVEGLGSGTHEAQELSKTARSDWKLTCDKEYDRRDDTLLTNWAKLVVFVDRCEGLFDRN